MTKLMAETNEIDMPVRLLIKNYLEEGKRISMRRKNRGVWEEYTWNECYQYVKGLSLGLISLGLQHRDKVSILGECQPEWLWAALAIQGAGATVVGVYTDCMPLEVKYYVDHSDSTFIIAEDQEQVDKILEIRDEVPKIKKLIYWDREGMYGYKDPFIMYFYDVVKLGMEYEKTHPGLFEHNIQKLKIDDVPIISYTSGTTGLAKGVNYSYRWLISNVGAWQELYPWRSTEQYLSYLNPAWPLEWIFGFFGGLRYKTVIHFPEEPETVQENIREVGPDIVFYGARMWESVASAVQARIADTHRHYRFIYDLFLPVGYKLADTRLSRRKLNLFWRLLYQLSEWILFRSLRDKLGLMKVRWGFTSGAGTSPEFVRFFHAIGVNLKFFYGITEPAEVCAPRENDIKLGTTGAPLPGYQVRISDETEILVSPRAMFPGYYKDPEAYQKAVVGGKWFCTGDAGHIDEDGHLIVMDRLTSLMKLDEGHQFSPDFIETNLRFSPYIEDAMVTGTGRAYIVAIIVIDYSNVGKWAEKHHLSYTTFTDLSQKPEVYDLIHEGVERVNKRLPEWARIRKYALLPKEFDPDEAELTRTRKLKRDLVEEKYKSMVEAMYTDKEEVEVETQLTYRDGRKGMIKTIARIKHVGNR